MSNEHRCDGFCGHWGHDYTADVDQGQYIPGISMGSASSEPGISPGSPHFQQGTVTLASDREAKVEDVLAAAREVRAAFRTTKVIATDELWQALQLLNSRLGALDGWKFNPGEDVNGQQRCNSYALGVRTDEARCRRSPGHGGLHRSQQGGFSWG